MGIAGGKCHLGQNGGNIFVQQSKAWQAATGDGIHGYRWHILLILGTIYGQHHDR